jgi:hypothetical protein
MSVTIFTSGHFERTDMPNGGSDIKVFFAGYSGNSLARYTPKEPFRLETDGVIFEFWGQGGLALDIISQSDFKRISGETSDDGGCHVIGYGTDDVKCENHSCSGKCKLRRYPLRCSCEK